MKNIILIIFQLISISAIGQNRDLIIKHLGLNSLSEEGKDTITHYYNNNFREVFTKTGGMFNRITITEEQKFLTNYFENKLDSSDLIILHNAWDIKIEKQKEKTRKRGAIYLKAMNCQKATLDSIRSFHYPKLMSFRRKLKRKLQNHDIKTIQKYYESSLKKLRFKRDQFIEYEEKFSKPQTPSIQDYMKYNFALMEEIPTVYYYKLVGGPNPEMNFVEELELENYFESYLKFEDDLIKKLGAHPCRAHLAIPFYHGGERYTGKYRKENAIVFAVINILK